MESKLFQPINIKNLTLKNRIVMSPMCMYSSENGDGKVIDWHTIHYTSRAIGGAGLVFLEATAILPEGRISEQDLGIWSDDQLPGLSKLVQLNHRYGSKIGIQLSHAGRKAQLEGTIFGPSPIRFDEHYKVPEEMNKEEINKVVSAFKEGARRAKAAGFDVIELHAAHGYLLHEFLSPLSNQRTDEYGGTEENRYRLLSEVVEAVKEVWDGPLFVRISGSDYLEGGLNIGIHIKYARQMKSQGVDLIDASSGGNVPVPVNAFPGYQVPFAEKIKTESGIMTGAVGLIVEPFQAEEILNNNRADLVFLGREFLRNPYWPLTAAIKLGAGSSLEAPRQYQRGWRLK
ncbi:NADPH dehydrogenase NamA [Sporolactobacillus sp. THM7-4]|nr:NADPH dehydrogenase NamA [Sporolactobacillus sp. THM7-4]